MEIYLVRHTTPDIEPGICYGISDIGLIDSFEEESRKTIDSLANTDIKVYSSPLSRCLKLACKISQEAIIDKRLLELNFGDWELKNWNDIPEEELNPWMENYFEKAPIKGESMNEMIDRVKSFLKDLPKEPCIVVTHHGVLKILEGIITGKDKKEFMNVKYGYGEIKHFKI